MRLSISNIAWDTSEDERISVILRTIGINAIDIAPSKYFADQSATSSSDIRKVRENWREREFTIVGLQSLLYGVKGLNLFGSDEDRVSLLEHLRHSCRIASGLGASRLVFGSPRNRDCAGLDYSQAEDLALNFFLNLGDIASNEGVTICIEANPHCYGCNFIVTTTEALSFVQKIQHPAIRLQLDTGTILTNKEESSVLLATLSSQPSLVGHIHISEPRLVPPGDAQSKLATLASLMRHYFPDEIATIEMAATTQEPHVVSVERAARWTKEHFTQQNC